MKEELTTFTLTLNDRVIIIKSVPSHVYVQCGETAYDNNVMRHIEVIVNKLRDVVTEVAITRYSEKSA